MLTYPETEWTWVTKVQNFPIILFKVWKQETKQSESKVFLVSKVKKVWWWTIDDKWEKQY